VRRKARGVAGQNCETTGHRCDQAWGQLVGGRRRRFVILWKLRGGRMVAPKKKEKSKIIWTSTVSQTPGSVAMKFRPPKETPKEATKGKLPCAEAVSVQQVILMMFVHLCRKVIYGLDVSYRICIYVLGVLMISVVSDYKTSSTKPSYFANPNNILNRWFVKVGWFWTCLVVGSFIYLTSHTYSCGRFNIIRNNFVRLAIATGAWFCVTSLFDMVEQKSGMCDITKYHKKDTCLASGNNWKGFDISGHCFLLIFSNLVMLEEGKAYLGWERIKDFIRNEEHRRLNDDQERSDTPLTKLKNEEFLQLRNEFPKRTPYVRLLFCLMALLMMFWDSMLLITVLYFHMMIEKVVASGAAVLTWFGLYKFIYTQSFSPGLPGEGAFKYVIWKDPVSNINRNKPCSKHKSAESKWSSKDEVPKFMGMPLYALKDYKEEKIKEDLTEEEVFYLNGMGAKRNSMSMSAMSSMDRLARGRQGSITDMPRTGRGHSRSQSRPRINSSRDGGGKNRLNHVNPVHL